MSPPPSACLRSGQRLAQNTPQNRRPTVQLVRQGLTLCRRVHLALAVFPNDVLDDGAALRKGDVPIRDNGRLSDGMHVLESCGRLLSRLALVLLDFVWHFELFLRWRVTRIRNGEQRERLLTRSHRMRWERDAFRWWRVRTMVGEDEVCLVYTG